MSDTYKIVTLIQASLMLVLLSLQTSAIPIDTLQNKDSQTIKSFAVLPDRNYTFNQILTDSSLHFVEGDPLYLTKSKTFWLKFSVYNPSKHPKKYIVWVYPKLKNTLYYFDSDQNKWLYDSAGVLVSIKERLTGNMRAVFDNNQNSLYVKMELHPLKNALAPIKPGIYLYKAETIDKEEAQSFSIWLATMLAVLVLSIYNMYLYFSFRDKTYLFYIIMQAGGMLYITGFGNFFNLFFNFGIGTFKNVSGLIYNSNLSYFFGFIGTMTIMYGFVQLTRVYLQTKIRLPRLDKLLNYLLFIFLALGSVSSISTITGLFYMDYYTLTIGNVLVLLLLLTILYIAILSYIRKYTAALPFLLANIVLLLIMIAITLIVIVSNSISYLSNIAIISQAITFSVAVVARIQLIEKELKYKTLEAEQLRFEIERIQEQQALNTLENEQIAHDIVKEKSKNTVLQEKIELNQREMASMVIYLQQKNSLLATISDQIQKLNGQLPHDRIKAIKGIQSTLRGNQSFESDWDKFKIHFEQIHPDFFENLQRQYPTLSKNEMRLSAYFHINLSTKEIATLLNIDAASVRTAKMRLNRKMNNDI